MSKAIFPVYLSSLQFTLLFSALLQGELPFTYRSVCIIREEKEEGFYGSYAVDELLLFLSRLYF